MAESTPVQERVPGLDFAESLEWQVKLRVAGFQGVSVAPLRGVLGRFCILVDAELGAPYQLVFTCVGECRSACSSNFYLPIRRPSPGRKERYPGPVVRGQYHFFEEC